LQSNIVVFFSQHGLSQLAILVNKQSVLDLLPHLVQSVGGSLYQTIGFGTLATLVMFFGLTERGTLVARLPQQGEFEETWNRVLIDTQRYLGVKTTTSALTGLLAGGICAAFGLPNAALWGAIAFWFNFVPVVGSLLAGIPPVFVALVTQSPSAAVAVGLGYLIVNVSIGNVLEPRWHGAAAGLSSLVVVISIAFWGGLMGPLGALIAVPLTMIVKLGCMHTRDLAWVARLLGRSEQRYSIFPRRSRPEAAPPRETLVSSREGLGDAQART
jgi:predicted PurR-regulated permease PerM